MADPATLGIIGIGSSLIGGIMQGEGKKQQYEAQSQVYNYQARIAEINSDIDKQNADYAIAKGEQGAEVAGLQGSQRLAQIKVAQAASGIDVNTGSAKEVQESQKKITTMDTNQIRANASKTAYDYNVQSVQDLNQAGLDRLAASNSSAAGNIALASSLVSTAGTVSSKWLQGQQSGIFQAS